MTALLLDVGNTRLKWGVLEDGKIRRTGHVSQERIRDKGLQVLTTRIPHGVDEVIASNVAGTSFATRLSGVVGAHCGCDVRFARTQRSGWGVTNSYSQPRRMGVDRWVAMVGAWAEVDSACLVVDAGTAITIDALDDSGRHLGGQIIAGVATMANALAAATSDIPLVKPGTGRAEKGLDMFASSTATAVRKGAHNAVTGAVDRAIRALQSESYDPVLVLTGGDSSRILDALGEAPLHRPHLVLQGLAHMLEHTR
ncbi:MAG TPA: type III pantothenate kinase [Woeseiaceae bacterium]|jgi:type III pantothenate kinase|nr:type III pantothenate kinase [Woeseiaceae bacterium]